MDLLHILLRLVHIGSGVLWVGGSVLFFLFIEPTGSELGPDAEKFMQGLIVKRRMRSTSSSSPASPSLPA